MIYKNKMLYKEAQKIMDQIKKTDDKSVWIRFENIISEDPSFKIMIVYQYEFDDGWMQWIFHLKTSA